MTLERARMRRRSVGQEDGQALLLMVFALVVLLGLAALVFDFGRAYLAQRQLQQAVDAAALVAGQTMPDTQAAYLAAVDYSATGKNKHPLNMTAGAPTIKFKCVASLAANNVPCLKDPPPVGGGSPSTPCSVDEPITKKCNAVQVTQSATVPTTFGRLFVPSLKVTARATVGMRGGAPHPLNIMIVLDRTGSMGDPALSSASTACGFDVTDPDGGTVISASDSRKIDCAKAGIRELLSGLLPCQPNLQVCGTAPPLDQVGLMVYPPLTPKDATTHDPGNPVHSNLNLDTSNSCSGQYTSKPGWYTPTRGFPNWFLQWPNDVGYGTPGAAAVAAVGEVNSLTVTGNPDAHSGGPGNTGPGSSYFVLTVNGATARINWVEPAPSAAAIQAAIGAIVGPANVTVIAQGTADNPIWNITFASSLGNVTFSVNNQLASGGISGNEDIRGVIGSPSSPQVDADYTFAPLSNDFRTTPDPGLNAGSRLVQGITWASCPGGTTTVGTRQIASETSTGYPGNRYYGINALGNTYFTGALLAAQNALAAEKARFPQRDAQPVIIFLSDGEANYFATNPCSTAISAAQDAALAGTWVYSIAYKISGTTRCRNPSPPGGDEVPLIDAYTTMSQIARNSETPTVPDSSKFFCPGTILPVPAPPVSCGNNATLSEVFRSIGTQLTASRLYSDDTFN